MLGAIAGEIIGSYYEFHKIKTKEFDLFHPKSKFTDDTTLSMAIAKSILDDEPYLDNIVDFNSSTNSSLGMPIGETITK